MEFVPLVLMVALVKKGVDFIKYVTSGDINAVVTQIVAWALGVGLAFLGANTDWAENFDVNGQALSTLNGWALVFAGVNIASLAGFGWDTLKAIDNRNSAVVPDLLAHPPGNVSTSHAPVVEGVPPTL
jgi:hypothetical protein